MIKEFNNESQARALADSLDLFMTKCKGIYIVGSNKDEICDKYKTFSIKNNNYFIIIARENISALKSTGRLPYSINAIYEMKADGVEHWLERIYDKQLLDLRTNNVESLTIF